MHPSKGGDKGVAADAAIARGSAAAASTISRLAATAASTISRLAATASVAAAASLTAAIGSSTAAACSSAAIAPAAAARLPPYVVIGLSTSGIQRYGVKIKVPGGKHQMRVGSAFADAQSASIAAMVFQATAIVVNQATGNIILDPMLCAHYTDETCRVYEDRTTNLRVVYAVPHVAEILARRTARIFARLRKSLSLAAEAAAAADREALQSRYQPRTMYPPPPLHHSSFAGPYGGGGGYSAFAPSAGEPPRGQGGYASLSGSLAGAGFGGVGSTSVSFGPASFGGAGFSGAGFDGGFGGGVGGSLGNRLGLGLATRYGGHPALSMADYARFAALSSGGSGSNSNGGLPHGLAASSSFAAAHASSSAAVSHPVLQQQQPPLQAYRALGAPEVGFSDTCRSQFQQLQHMPQMAIRRPKPRALPHGNLYGGASSALLGGPPLGLQAYGQNPGYYMQNPHASGSAAALPSSSAGMLGLAAEPASSLRQQMPSAPRREWGAAPPPEKRAALGP